MKLKSKIISLFLTAAIAMPLIFTGCSTEDESYTAGDNESSYSEEEADVSDDEDIEEETPYSSGNVKIHFIDTGNSDAILIQEGETGMIIDAGDNDDETRVVNYIKKQGIKDVKYVVATHAHADHVGGLDAVVRDCNIGRVFISNGDANTKTYRDFVNAIADKGLNPSVPLENKKFYLKDSYFEVFNTNGGSTTNNESLVVLLTNGNNKMLFMGDAEREVEEEILSEMPDVDILKIGHHGSNSSSIPSFLDKTKPEYAVALCGKNNDYGHPHKEVVQRLKDRNIPLYRTDQCGTIVFESDGENITTSSKAGNYKSGNESKGSSSDSYNEEYNSSSSNSNIDKNTTVYWTKNGKVYHLDRNCTGLSNSKNVMSGTVSESEKPRVCKRCGK